MDLTGTGPSGGIVNMVMNIQVIKAVFLDHVGN
jgi:hypothetical protein